ncbi:MAG: ester cyclase [Verrucomicrobiia bacterium]
MSPDASARAGISNIHLTMTEGDNKVLARRLLEEVVNSGDVSRLPEFLAPDYRVRHTDQIGIEAAGNHLLTFHHCYPDLAVTVDGQVAEDDIVVAWYTMRGTHRGEWGGIKPTNKVLTLRGVSSAVSGWSNRRAVGWSEHPRSPAGNRSDSIARRHQRVTPAVNPPFIDRVYAPVPFFD